MRKPSLASAVFFSLVVSLALGCATTTGPGGPVSAKPKDVGPYECVDAGTTASPPPRAVLDLGMVRDSKTKVYRGRRKPLLTFRLCPRGKVPVSRVVALRAFPKGNPLLGLVEGTTEAFFTDREIGESIRRSRLPFEKVYTIPPGPDDQPHAVPPDPPGCNGVPSFGTCYYYGPAAYRRTADGGGMTMEIERPAFSGDGHSLDELAVQGGPGDGHIVELGWNVSPNQYGDGDPHLFVFHWINWSPTCYDGCGWQQYSATYFPRMNLRVLRGRDVYIGYVYYQGTGGLGLIISGWATFRAPSGAAASRAASSSNGSERWPPTTAFRPTSRWATAAFPPIRPRRATRRCATSTAGPGSAGIATSSRWDPTFRRTTISAVPASVRRATADRGDDRASHIHRSGARTGTYPSATGVRPRRPRCSGAPVRKLGMRHHCPFWFFFLVLALGPRAGGAGQDVWTPLALDGGSVYLLAASPTAGTVYAATAASLFKSLDDGITWRWSGSGLPLTDWRPTVLRVDPLHPRVVYLGGSLGLFKSGDSGRTWRQLAVGAPSAQAIVREIAFDPRRTATLYLALDTGLFKSTDAGATWRRLRSFPGGCAAVVVDPRAPTKVYAVATAGQLYLSTDAGASWRALKRAVRHARQLTIDPADSRRLFGIADGKLVRSVNGGSTWRSTPLAGTEVFRLAVASSGGRIYVLTRRGVYASEDGGATLVPLPTTLRGELLQSLAVAPGDPEHVWVGAVDPPEVFAVLEPRSRGGVFRTSDGGASWTREIRGLSALTVDAVTLLPDEDSTLFAGTPVGLFRSRDGGATFDDVDLGLGEPASVAGLFRAPGRLFAVTSAGEAHRVALLRSDNGGATWERLPAPAATAYWSLLANAPQRLLLATTFGLFASFDDGKSWQAAPELRGVSVLDLAADGASADTVYASGFVPGFRFTPAELRVFRSDDGGRTWERIDAGLTGPSVTQMAADPDRPGHLFGIVGFSLRESTDGGGTWQLKSSFATLAPLVTELLAAGDRTLYAATSGHGVFRSRDDGATWEPINAGLRGLDVRALALDASDPGRLVAGLQSGGMVEISQD